MEVESEDGAKGYGISVGGEPGIAHSTAPYIYIII